MSADTVTALPKSAAAPARAGGVFDRIRNVEPVILLWVLLIAVLLFLVAAPLVKLFTVSFETQGTGAFTLSNYSTAYGRARYLDALVNSLTLGLSSATIAVVLAVPIRWPGRCRGRTCRGRGSPGAWCLAPSWCRPTSARSAGFCSRGRIPVS
jgi:hypothetical protein